MLRDQVTDVNDPEFRCYELDLVNTAGSTQTMTVSAGSTVGFKGTHTRALCTAVILIPTFDRSGETSVFPQRTTFLSVRII